MNQWREEMEARTHKFAVDVIHFVEKIPTRLETRRLKDQLLTKRKSGSTSHMMQDSAPAQNCAD
jgi:hypothetical protein